MQFRYNLNLTFDALRRWFIGQLYDCACVSVLWYMALRWIGAPGALFWAFTAGVLQFIPHLGPLLALMGPAVAMGIARQPGSAFLRLLGAYVVIALLDSLLLQPWLMQKQNRVPAWASILTPVVLGILWPFWGVLFAPPLLAVIYALRHGQVQATPPPTGEQKFTSQDEGIILAPERHDDATGRGR